ncbi:MAG: endo-1,4-beta-xylanase [Bacteroidales bacterium]|nr:endo-1,4-beta-xylanase [Bacteroidales bacterium]
MPVTEKYEDLLTELKKRNAPLDGIGIQAHEPRQDWFSPVEVWKTFDLYSKFGYPIHITEFTPQSSGVPITGGWRTGNWTQQSQAEFTEQFFQVMFRTSFCCLNQYLGTVGQGQLDSGRRVDRRGIQAETGIQDVGQSDKQYMENEPYG